MRFTWGTHPPLENQLKVRSLSLVSCEYKYNGFVFRYLPAVMAFSCKRSPFGELRRSSHKFGRLKMVCIVSVCYYMIVRLIFSICLFCLEFMIKATVLQILLKNHELCKYAKISLHIHIIDDLNQNIALNIHMFTVLLRKQTIRVSVIGIYLL